MIRQSFPCLLLALLNQQVKRSIPLYTLWGESIQSIFLLLLTEKHTNCYQTNAQEFKAVEICKNMLWPYDSLTMSYTHNAHGHTRHTWPHMTNNFVSELQHRPVWPTSTSAFTGSILCLVWKASAIVFFFCMYYTTFPRGIKISYL
jgi:hypothetical protein